MTNLPWWYDAQRGEPDYISPLEQWSANERRYSRQTVRWNNGPFVKTQTTIVEPDVEASKRALEDWPCP